MAQEIRDAAGHLIGYELEHTAQHVDDMCDRTEALEETEEAVAGYSQSAQSNAQAAAQSAASAASDKTAAAQSASQAQASAAQAAADATATETAKTAAQTAKTAAEAARDRAEAAASTAEGAKTDALNAQAAAETASSTAVTAATNASRSETSASTDASRAEAAAIRAEEAAEEAEEHASAVTSVNGQTGTVVLTKSDINLGNVDNTSDAEKKAAFTGAVQSGNTGFVTGGDVYTALQGAGKVESVNGQTGVVVLGKSDVGLGNVDNTSDADKPISTATQEGINTAVNRYLRLIDLGTFASGSEFQSWYSSSGMKADISSGQFQKALVGHKVTINGHVYYFAHPDYWYRSGDTECTTHHMLVVPAGNLLSGQMNRTNVTTGAYIGSDMYTGSNGNTALADAKAIIRQDFGAANILTHREHFCNAVAGSYESAGTWYDSDIDLMCERMVYGCDIFHNCINGTGWPAYWSLDKSQLKLFAERPDLITTRAHWWLRDVAGAPNFALVNWDGCATASDASSSSGVRPAFAIC